MKKLAIALVLSFCMILLSAYQTHFGNFNIEDTLMIDSVAFIYNDNDTLTTAANISFTGNTSFDGTFLIGDTLTVESDIIADGYVIGRRSGVYAYLQENDTTEIVTADSLHLIQGVFINSPIYDFKIANFLLVFTGTDTGFYEIIYNASVSSNTATTVAHIAIVNDDSTYNAQRMGSLLKNANEPYFIGGNLVIQLTENDTIRLAVEADKTCELDFRHFTTSIKRFY